MIKKGDTVRVKLGGIVYYGRIGKVLEVYQQTRPSMPGNWQSSDVNPAYHVCFSEEEKAHYTQDCLERVSPWRSIDDP
jgi:hypothetical protein